MQEGREIVQERFVKYDVAKWLDTNGFDGECYWYYPKRGGEIQQLDWHELNYQREDFIKAPTHQMAMDWLREEMGIEILLDVSFVNRTYNYTIVVWKPTGGDIIHSDEYYPKYAQCVDAALEYCLTNLLNYDTD